MLVLTRRANESIVIGDDITVTVLAVTPGGVRIGIDAPRDKRINRAEIVVAVGDANQEALHASADASAQEALLAALGRRGPERESSS
ncbi:carbon storage regulator CsrA [Streptomyces sp. AC495_CC817]|uniref:carbon storage regulator CsrA n=1 Tax=Streptomyces sp. AC495_CC817 TaxID=2823900 RepID=UPI001C258F45|nr:carbon storage regulator CsrA [Streptomyces sp. AC495_CC817]